MILSIDNLEKYLGKPVSYMLSESPFRDWKFQKSVEEDLEKPRIDYIFPQGGLDLICDADDKVRTIFIYNDELRHFEGEILNPPLSSNRQEVIERLGPPSKNGCPLNDPILGEFGPWDRFARPGYSIHVEYKVDCDHIKKITFMRADIVP